MRLTIVHAEVATAPALKPEPITVVVWKWKRIRTGHQIPHVVQYGAKHVNTFASMLRRRTTVPYRLVCVTDDPTDITTELVEIVPLWELYEAGGCYHRLRCFAPDAHKLFGPRFVWIDLDCVITGSMDALLTTPGDFVINRYDHEDKPQWYNGSFVMMDAGARPQVWNRFHPVDSPLAMKALNASGEKVGSDQAWIAHVLGPNERTVGPDDGIRDVAKIGDILPEDTRIVFFSGPRDPSQMRHPWIRQHWK